MLACEERQRGADDERRDERRGRDDEDGGPGEALGCRLRAGGVGCGLGGEPWQLDGERLPDRERGGEGDADRERGEPGLPARARDQGDGDDAAAVEDLEQEARKALRDAEAERAGGDGGARRGARERRRNHGRAEEERGAGGDRDAGDRRPRACACVQQEDGGDEQPVLERVAQRPGGDAAEAERDLEAEGGGDVEAEGSDDRQRDERREPARVERRRDRRGRGEPDDLERAPAREAAPERTGDGRAVGRRRRRHEAREEDGSAERRRGGADGDDRHRERDEAVGGRRPSDRGTTVKRSTSGIDSAALPPALRRSGDRSRGPPVPRAARGAAADPVASRGGGSLTAMDAIDTASGQKRRMARPVLSTHPFARPAGLSGAGRRAGRSGRRGTPRPPG